MYKLTLEQKISNLEEQLDLLDEKAERIVRQADGIKLKLEKLKAQQANNNSNSGLFNSSTFSS